MSIHAMKRGDDYVYRWWGRVGGGYYTPEMTEAQLSRWLLEYELEKVVRGYGFNLAADFERARRGGTSCRITRKRDMSVWREPENGEDDHITDDAEDYMGKMVNVIQDAYYGDGDKPLVLPNGKKLKVTIIVEEVE